MLLLNAPALERLEEFATSFAEDFRRCDQARWLNVYLRGLLTKGSRKNTESLARCVSLSAGLRVEDLAQALQNFVNQSPWNESKLWRRYRAWMTARCDDPTGILVVSDVAIPKQGRNSVGVHRQFAGDLGKKINCQLAVSVSYVGQSGCFPLALRLYLPRSWSADPDRLKKVGVPPEYPVSAGKRQIALGLLDEVCADGFTPRVVLANETYGSSQEFRDGLAERGWSYLVGVDKEFPVVVRDGMTPAPFHADPSARGASRLLPVRGLAGLDFPVQCPGVPGRFCWLPVWLDGGPAIGVAPFPGPYQLLIEQRADGTCAHALGDLKGTVAAEEALAAWNHRRLAEESFTEMKEKLGLDHFEGRSWRGFHHHTCLVALAYGFRIAEQARSRSERTEGRRFLLR